MVARWDSRWVESWDEKRVAWKAEMMVPWMALRWVMSMVVMTAWKTADRWDQSEVAGMVVQLVLTTVWQRDVMMANCWAEKRGLQ